MQGFASVFTSFCWFHNTRNLEPEKRLSVPQKNIEIDLCWYLFSSVPGVCGFKYIGPFARTSFGLPEYLPKNIPMIPSKTSQKPTNNIPEKNLFTGALVAWLRPHIASLYFLSGVPIGGPDPMNGFKHTVLNMNFFVFWPASRPLDLRFWMCREGDIRRRIRTWRRACSILASRPQNIRKASSKDYYSYPFVGSYEQRK